MYTLVIANKNYSSWSLRPWLMLRELGVAFNEKLIPFGTATQREMLAVSPTGKVPCLLDGNTTVWDSLAIIEYLAEHHADVWPSDAQARAWARCAAAEMHSGFSTLRNVCGMNVGIRVKLHAMSDALLADITRIDALWRQGLSTFGGPFLAGDKFSAVDAFFAPITYRVISYHLPVSEEAQQYIAHLHNLVSLQEWTASALQEPWRDEPHEEESRAAGVWLADLRVR
jgi:glutathione S-transferase